MADRLKTETSTGNAAFAPMNPVRFETVYDEHFAFVWRSVRRLGIRDFTEDLVQQVFIVVYRRLGDFEYRSSIKTWIYSITRRVVKDHFRTQRRKPRPESLETLPADESALSPLEEVSRASARKTLQGLLMKLDDEKREVFMLAELEEMTVPEIAEALDLNTNTAYSRLRAGRQAFDREVKRFLAREEGRQG